MNSMVQTINNLDFIPPVRTPEDIRGTAWEDWEKLIQEIVLHSNYEFVILDIGGAVDGTFQVLDMCRRIYMPVLSDPVSISKIAQFEMCIRDRCINVGIFGFCRIKGNADTCARFHITGRGVLCPLCKAGYGCAIASLKCDGICCMADNCTADCAGEFPAPKRIRIITGDCCKDVYKRQMYILTVPDRMTNRSLIRQKHK